MLQNLPVSEEPPLRINMDETSIVLNHDGQKGVVSKGLAKDVVLINKKSKKTRILDIGCSCLRRYFSPALAPTTDHRKRTCFASARFEEIGTNSATECNARPSQEQLGNNSNSESYYWNVTFAIRPAQDSEETSALNGCMPSPSECSSVEGCETISDLYMLRSSQLDLVATALGCTSPIEIESICAKSISKTSTPAAGSICVSGGHGQDMGTRHSEDPARNSLEYSF